MNGSYRDIITLVGLPALNEWQLLGDTIGRGALDFGVLTRFRVINMSLVNLLRDYIKLFVFLKTNTSTW